MKEKFLLVLAVVLILIGITKPNLSLISNNSNKIDIMELSEPIDSNILKESKEVVSLIKSYKNISKNDFKKLRDLMLDLSILIKLDGEDKVITNTDEIRQANSLAGVMLKLDMKDKYKDLAKETHDVIVAAVGDDNIPLSDDLRTKGVDGFNALAWAFNEGSK